MAIALSSAALSGKGTINPLTRALHFDHNCYYSSTPKLKPIFSLSPKRPRFSSRAAATMSYDKELAAAKKACSLAARLCQKVQKALLQSDVHAKSDKSPVTVADYGSQAVVSFVLQKELSSSPFSLVAEEDSGDLRKEDGQETLQRITKLVNETLANGGTASPLSDQDVLAAIDSGKSEGGSLGQHWVLDPIDGTKGFLRGDQYAIALGLLDEGKVVLGVLACPNLPLQSLACHDQHTIQGKAGCLFFAQVGTGTYMQSLDGSEPRKVHVSSTENPEEASFFESYEAAHSMHDLTSLIAKKLGVKAPPVRIDSQAKYGALSRGDGAIYMRFPHRGYREKIWDHAAGSVVVTEAGGVVTDAAGKPLDFSRGRYLDLDTGIIVTNQKLMPTLLNAVQESLKEKASSL
ncbi:3'(2'),5'-bisphosphate nucleotidase 1-like isoform X1 [Coffea arabica]|uniref:3'(2'),5'-bisphosphate nucleotidase 1-like isoform X1 n=1 Tax=Coffea arabica TaxID=13443 RepID=A0A6P6TCR5_COFAR|nr:SAL1 phosphatase-like isoform X1 [Coffea arabica]